MTPPILDAPRHRLDVGATPVAWHEFGDGPPVVLIHGIPTGPALWRHVVRRVEGARLLVFEMVGFADSIPAGRDHDISVGAQATHLLAWLDELEIDRAALVGHDLGGGVAQIAAVRDPERCAGLVLTNTIAYDSWPIPSVKALRAGSSLLRHLPGAVVYPVLATLMARGHDDLAVARESLAVHWRPYAEHGAAAALAQQVSALDVDDTRAIADRLPDLDVSARLVWGAADQFQTIDYGRRLAEDLSADLTEIPDGKHFVPEDHPDAIADAIAKVLSEL